MKECENFTLAVPRGTNELNFVLQIADERTNTKREPTPTFTDNAYAALFNAEMSYVTDGYESYSAPPDSFSVACLSYYCPEFAAEYLAELIDGGFLECDAFPFFCMNKPTIKKDRLLLTTGILTYTALSGDDKFLRSAKVFKYIKSRLSLAPESLPEAVTLLFANQKAHELIGDRLFTVQNVTGLTRHLNGNANFGAWQKAKTENEILAISKTLKLPLCFAYLSILERVYGISVIGGCLSLNPLRGALPSVTVSACDKKISLTYVEGYPKRMYIGNVGISGAVKIDDLQGDYTSITVVS